MESATQPKLPPVPPSQISMGCESPTRVPRGIVAVVVAALLVACDDPIPTPVPTTVTVSPSSADLAALGETVQLTATVKDQNGNTMRHIAVTWSSSAEGIVTVNAQGLITAAGNGRATITARAETVSGDAAVTVEQVPAAMVLDPDSLTFMALGDTATLEAYVVDANGYPIVDAGVAWSSDNTDIALVTAEGLVTSAGNGRATVTAMSQDVSRTAAVTVEQAPATVTLDPDSLSFVALGDTLRLAAVARDANGHSVAAEFTWTSGDQSVASVDSTGLVTAAGNGEVAVSAAIGEVVGSAEVAVSQVPASVTVSPVEAAITVDDTLRLAAEAFDANGHLVVGAAFAWLSGDTAVAVVDATGLVRAVGNGQATITAAAGSAFGTAAVTVAWRVAAVIVRPLRAIVEVGDAVQLSAEAVDGWGEVLEGIVINWESNNESVATVNTAGRIRAVGSGTAVITATAESSSGRVRLTVVDKSERGVLVALFHSTGGVNWVDKTNWLTSASLEDWHGVTVDENGRVVRLDLEANSLTGPIPPEIGQLTELRHLNLSSNGLTGPIPPEIGNLRSLTDVNLAHNALSGPIPPEVGQLTGMTSLWLGRNRLSGPVPPAIDRLTRLERLDLGDNDLTGEFPAELVLPRLKILRVQGNHFRGSVPSSILGSALELFLFSHPVHRNVELCLPGTSGFVDWSKRVGETNPRYCNESDRAVLESLYETTSGDVWSDDGGWLSGPALAEWAGVESDALGRVTELDLTDNGLSGELPAALGRLTDMTRLNIGENSLAGRLPQSLTAVPLSEFRYAGTELCTPANDPFRAWLRTIAVHEGTGVECGDLTDRDILTILYRATDGPNWTERRRWLTDAPLDDWYGVQTGDDGRVTSLALPFNGLKGFIPAELGKLARLEELNLHSNRLTGSIPAELGNLSNLRILYLFFNLLTGSVPAELGKLSALEHLWLQNMPMRGGIPPELGELSNLQFLGLMGINLSGSIPPELGQLSKLERLYIDGNHLTGSIPREFGDLSELALLSLLENRLSGSIPRELGRLAKLEGVYLHGNELTGPVPRELGDLLSARTVNLAGNDLSGPLPAGFGRLTGLEHLVLTDNARMDGFLPRSLSSLNRMETFLAGGTQVCAPPHPDFQEWLAGVEHRRVLACPTGETSRAYLTQAVQSLGYPVPLVANEAALLRVFVTAVSESEAKIPPMRATFYHSGEEVHVENIPGGTGTIPIEIEEGELSRSGNAEIPRRLVKPGLEFVIEVDPENTLDPALGVQKRIPRIGRQAVTVEEMPEMHLTWIPMISADEPDSSVLDVSRGLTQDSELFWMTRTLLPVGDFEVDVHDLVETSSRNIFELLRQVEAIRVMENGQGYYMGAIGNPEAATGVADLGGLSSVVIPGTVVTAHELGHNFNLLHAPCGNPGNEDPSFPSPTGSIGAWGYDFRGTGRLVPPGRKDLMSYCGLNWISDYGFTMALSYRVNRKEARRETASSDQSLLLWGGVDQDGTPILEPALVVNAPPVLPATTGDYELTGRTAGGERLFRVSFDLREVSKDGPRPFVFALPTRPEWVNSLAAITLSGPDGTVTMDGYSQPSVAILRDAHTGRVRGILRGVERDAAASFASARGGSLDVLFSRGIPDETQWR